MILNRSLFALGLALCVTALHLFNGCKSSQTTQQPNPESFRNIPANALSPAPTDTVKVDPDIDYFDRMYIRQSDHVYRDNIHTVLLYPDGDPLSRPILHLGGTQQLQLHFDVFSEERYSFTYKIVHCNANWQPSELIEQEYMEGFTNDEINRAESSENTLQPYTHYQYAFPNDRFKLTRSGNYLIHLYDGTKLVLTKRFMITENKITVAAEVKRPTLIADQNYKQELDLTILHPAYPINDPYRSLVVILQQNNRWDNAVVGIQPNFVKNNELVYDHDEENVFEGGNEFRSVDIKNMRFQAGTIDRIQVESDGRYHVYLQDDEPRSYKQYLTDQDINGKFIIKKDETEDVHIESDYVYVHFSLPYSRAETTGDIYLFGQLTNWEINENYRMQYDTETKRYTKTLYLKQGYYEYNYAFLEDQKKEAEFVVVEGTHQETENDYSILVYYRQPGENYDRLIAVKNLNSVKKK
jgi:hypothetical protein